jgi:D-amino peptidase
MVNGNGVTAEKENEKGKKGEGVKIYIHTDLEGVAGLDREEQRQKEKAELYRQSCEKLMLDVNAAVAGAFEGGAEVVTVLDSHGGGGNFIVEMLDERADHDTKENRKWWRRLDDSYDGTFFIGAHAMAGTINGFLDHTQSSLTWFTFSINGRPSGELAQWAVVAGGFGVPMLMVSGDAAACAEARAFFNPIETAPVKQGTGRNAALGLPEDEARVVIRSAARRAMSLVGKAKPYQPLKPMDIRITYTRSDYCDAIAQREGWERMDARTVRRVTDDPHTILPWG